MTASRVVGSTFFGGLRSPHYVNGRLLTAEDLKADQDAMLARLAGLGQAVGHGVVEGLAVKAGVRQLTVAAGLGVNRHGSLVRLPGDVTLGIVPDPAVAAGRGYDGFDDCAQPVLDAGGRVDAGAYVLTARPASQLEGRVPVKSATAAPAGCVGKWEVGGVEFRTFRVDADEEAERTGNADVRRNLLAHWCFGTAALSRAPVDPFGFGPTWSGLDSIGLPSADLPLAVFWWTGSTVEFLDVWSARRRIVSPGALTGWHPFLSDGRVADSQARFLQFQQHVDELVAAGVAPGTAAVDAFRFLPPAGFLPLAPKSLLDRLDAMAGGPMVKAKPPLFEWNPLLNLFSEPPPKAAYTSFASYITEPKADVFSRFLGDVQSELLSLRKATDVLASGDSRGVGEPDAQPTDVSAGRRRRQAAKDRAMSRRRNALRLALRSSRWEAGFDLQTFFGELPSRIGLVDRETVDFTLQRSWFDEPIDLTPPSGTKPAMNLYLVEDSLVDRSVPPYVLFAKAIKPITWLGVGDTSG